MTQGATKPTVLKFGGTSVATPDAIRRMIEIVRAARSQGPSLVVVSAFGGVTNQLIAAAEAAAQRDEGYREQLAGLAERHLAAARGLAPEEETTLAATLRSRFGDLGDLLHGVFLLRELSPRARDSILSYGERCSAEVVAAALRCSGLAAIARDARHLIVTDDAYGQARVDTGATNERLRSAFAELSRDANDAPVPIITGFVAASPEGHTTTLGRGGSDYTAALVGAALGARAIELWTDVSGVLSTDPRVVPEAFPQPAMSYAELMELSHFGAKVVYPPSIHPARSAGIPLVIKNTFDPSAPGTRVTGESAPNPWAIRGLASVHRVALVRLEGDGMVGVPGIAGRLFGALAREGVSVILISQGSSEHSICFAVAPDDTVRARRVVEEEFVLERRAGLVDDLVVEEDQAVLAAVGETMHERPGLAGRLFSVLGQHGVNVKSIAQGSSELNVSLVVDHRDEARALRAIHGAFFFPRRRRLTVAVAGLGRVGATLVEQIRQVAPRLLEEEDLDVRVAALFSRRHGLLERDGLDLADWRQGFEEAPAADPEGLIETLSRPEGDSRVLADCTASDTMVPFYKRLLASRIGVAAANKRPFAGPLADWRQLHESQRLGGPLYLEATVGAGLPVLSTLADLVASGDTIRRIDGILSGTLNAVLDRMGQGASLSGAVRGAFDEGLTEPHPWDDLSGMDVARKLCILARLAGYAIEPEAVEVEPLLPGEDWGNMDLETFWDQLPSLDAEFAHRRDAAADDGRRLRYVAQVADDAIRVGLEEVDEAHPAYALAGPDNLVAFSTDRYCDTPLVIRGPGAGPAVTAAGVLADILRAARKLEGVSG